MQKRILYLDMDGVLADFCASPLFKKTDPIIKGPPRMYEQFFFETLSPLDGALWGVRMIMQMEKFDIHILTQPVKETHYSYSEKDSWVKKWFPELIGKLSLTQNKEHSSKEGRILVDDSAIKWKDKWEKEGGEFIFFDYNLENHKSHRQVWENLVDNLQENY